MPKPPFRHIAIVFVFAALMCGTAGCSFYDSGESIDDGSGDSSGDTPEVQPPADEKIQDDSGAHWTCFWNPTINNDWHDDELCQNGNQFLRPTLLPNSKFVTQDEMVAAGDAYAAQLNG
jgi:hypothetical protein